MSYEYSCPYTEESSFGKNVLSDDCYTNKRNKSRPNEQTSVIQVQTSCVKTAIDFIGL